MPRGFSLADLPNPDDLSIRLREAPSIRLAVLRFSGLAGDTDLSAKTGELKSILKSRSLVPAGSPVVAQYNPPWTPWFMRRNEVMIRSRCEPGPSVQGHDRRPRTEPSRCTAIELRGACSAVIHCVCFNAEACDARQTERVGGADVRDAPKRRSKLAIARAYAAKPPLIHPIVAQDLPGSLLILRDHGRQPLVAQFIFD